MKLDSRLNGTCAHLASKIPTKSNSTTTTPPTLLLLLLTRTGFAQHHWLFGSVAGHCNLGCQNKYVNFRAENTAGASDQRFQHTKRNRGPLTQRACHMSNKNKTYMMALMLTTSKRFAHIRGTPSPALPMGRHLASSSGSNSPPHHDRK